LVLSPAFAGRDIDKRPGEATLYEIVSGDPNFSVLTLALEATGLDELADSNEVRLTVFAPNDEAFEKVADELGFADVDALVDFLVDGDLLDDVLAYHVVEGRRFSNSVVNRNNNKLIETFLGQYVTSTPMGMLIDQSEMTSNAVIIGPNLSASNGVAHVIDNVLVPVLGDD
jgi:uncharacterized surface protein with fasciclin (FAS1) repeats